MDRTVALILTSLLAACAAYAQMPPGQPAQGGMGPGMAPNVGAMGNPGAPRYGGDALAESFFAPELIMQNQRAVGLSAEQQVAMRSEMQEVMPRLTDLQWQQSAQTEMMLSLVSQARPDEKQALAQFDKLLTLESEIKRLHLGMLLRLKNMLTPDQQARLRGLRLPMMMGLAPGVGGPQGSGMWAPGREDLHGQGQGRPPAGPPEPAPQAEPAW